MAYLLDTNAAIALMKHHPTVQSHVRRVGRQQLRICATVESELWFGVAKSTRVTENSERLLRLLDWLPSLPFSGEATRRFGEIRVYLNRQGTPIGPYDLQIAAIALAAELTLVTNNTSEFERVPGLRCEDWMRMK
ncbi:MULTISPECIES: PIN domain-containing protein [Thiorhodovibrio]|uniref:PIN domain-containing protein n=1 Tax=Thiorhodovibrio TaxID=61593 RepID=UPI0019141BF7|nr:MULTISPECIES: PIN domain-containing protein [Thiorhodovibrio]MBK5969192.1 VapC toxin family PIN domain ribonuclease [Thiorhodovibrio winogradskyi]WPL11183.1 tRNA(fMet)-specific endonuclease VapC [Thiorhodovibrio litoralis]